MLRIKDLMRIIVGGIGRVANALEKNRGRVSSRIGFSLEFRGALNEDIILDNFTKG